MLVLSSYSVRQMHAIVKTRRKLEGQARKRMGIKVKRRKGHVDPWRRGRKKRGVG